MGQPTPETLRALAQFAQQQADDTYALAGKHDAEARRLRYQADRLERIPKLLRPLLGRFVL